jgi:hypothetical protein
VANAIWNIHPEEGERGLRRRARISPFRERPAVSYLRIHTATGGCIVINMRRKLFTRGALVALTLAASAAVFAESTSASAATTDSASARRFGFERRFATQFDNDLFSGRHRDKDYSWGLSTTLATDESHALQFGLIAMTPSDLVTPQLTDDRPYASLLFVTRSKMNVHASDGRATFTSLTLGALGLPAAETLQRNVHNVIGGKVPQGWHHQISNGGEPTARYVRAEQWLLGAADALRDGAPETKLTLSGSAGFLTEASAALSLRWGRIASPWYSHTPELADYSPAPVAPVASFAGQRPRETFGFVGGRLKARAYNAFLQGQFRHSDLRFSHDELEPMQAEVWGGFATTWDDFRVTYTLRVASKEVSHGPAARTLVWGAVTIDRTI